MDEIEVFPFLLLLSAEREDVYAPGRDLLGARARFRRYSDITIVFWMTGVVAAAVVVALRSGYRGLPTLIIVVSGINKRVERERVE